MVGATSNSTRGSSGFGMMYSGPNWSGWSPYAFTTASGTSCFARSASASAHATFISSLMSVARTSSAPRKMNGNPRTLFTWFG